MGKSVRFWDMIAKRYAKSRIADEGAYQKKLTLTRERLHPNMDVLEFGCGTGTTALAHAPYVKHILAIDISSKMLEIARAKADSSGISNITFDQAAIDDFTALDQSFDVVLGLSILHLVEDRKAVIRKVHRLLKPGGVFISSTACLGDTLPVFKYIGPVGHFVGLLPLVKVFTGQELREDITAAGFEIEYDWLPTKKAALFLISRKSV